VFGILPECKVLLQEMRFVECDKSKYKLHYQFPSTKVVPCIYDLRWTACNCELLVIVNKL